jgi:DNA-directed RNA polymerase specialized sigma24 family protein
MANALQERHRILREVYRHYIDFYDFFRRTGQDTIDYRGLTISFLDLKKGVDKLAGRKKEAFHLNVIRDMKQKEVAEIMGITTVSVGQYVDAACRQLSEEYFKNESLTS